jgi:hypothetical protein
MNIKKIVTVALLIFVATSIGYMVVREQKSSIVSSRNSVSLAQPQPAAISEINQVNPNEQIVVYYFHGDVRCPTCHKLEQYAKEALDTYFAEELAKGKILWRPTNVDALGNEHFIKDYELVTKSIILSKVVNGRQIAWKNLDRIWQLVRDRGKYLEYISDSITSFAAEGQK